jgi:uncharacterized protein (DUF2336 family)
MHSDTSHKEPTFGLDTSIFMHVIENGDAEQRSALAAQLAAFLCSEEAPANEREQVVPVVLKLAIDPVKAVRQALAHGLVRLKALNADILFSIISDDDDLALPFLAETPALTHWHMLAILRVGDDARQVTVLLRPDISAEAVEYAVKSLPIKIVVLMFENEAVHFTVEQYHALYQRFGHAREMLDVLLACSDLPLDIRITQAKRASNRMHQLMAERGWLPANDAAELVADAEETAVLNILTQSASDEELAHVVNFLVNKGMLTPSIIVRAACLGEMFVLEQALAHLAGIPRKKAHELMRGKGIGGFKGLHSKSGLPSSTLWILQAAVDVARDEDEEGIKLSADDFGRRIIEALMTRYEAMPGRERARHLDYVSRFAADRPRLIAKRLKADLVRAA